MSEDLNGGAAPAPAEPTAAPVAASTDSAVSTTETSAPANPEVTLDDELSSIWDEAQSADDEPASSPPGRDERGRFVSSRPEASPESGDQNTDPQPGEGEGAADEGTVDPSTPAVSAPVSWSGAMKAEFAKLPPGVQEYVLQREGDAHRAITQAGQRLKAYEPLDQLVRENADHFEKHGVHPVEAFQGLLQAQQMLDNDPVGGLVQLGLSYGIDLRPMLGIDGGLPNTGADPMVRAMQQQLQQLQSQVSQQTRAQQQAAEQAAAQERSQLQASIAEFAKGKPHFEAVKPTMAALLRSGQAEDLAQAYDMAIHAVPAVRQRVLEEQRAATDKTRIADVRRAQRAASVNTRSVPSSATPKSLDDELNAIASKHYGR